MTTNFSNNRKMILSGAAVLAFGVAAYGLGRVYPPLGPSEGTVAPAQSIGGPGDSRPPSTAARDGGARLSLEYLLSNTAALAGSA